MKKVLIIIGETKVGKTTLVRSIINYEKHKFNFRNYRKDVIDMSNEDHSDDNTTSNTRNIRFYKTGELLIIDAPGVRSTELNDENILYEISTVLCSIKDKPINIIFLKTTVDLYSYTNEIYKLIIPRNGNSSEYREYIYKDIFKENGIKDPWFAHEETENIILLNTTKEKYLRFYNEEIKYNKNYMIRHYDNIDETFENYKMLDIFCKRYGYFERSLLEATEEQRNSLMKINSSNYTDNWNIWYNFVATENQISLNKLNKFKNRFCLFDYSTNIVIYENFDNNNLKIGENQIWLFQDFVDCGAYKSIRKMTEIIIDNQDKYHKTIEIMNNLISLQNQLLVHINNCNMSIIKNTMIDNLKIHFIIRLNAYMSIKNTMSRSLINTVLIEELIASCQETVNVLQRIEDNIMLNI